MEQRECPDAWRKSVSFRRGAPGSGPTDYSTDRQWVNIRFWLLRRLLLCYRVKIYLTMPTDSSVNHNNDHSNDHSNDPSTSTSTSTSTARVKSICEYLAVTVQLLAPCFASLFEDGDAQRAELQADLMCYAAPLGGGGLPGAQLPPEVTLVFPAQPLFSFGIAATLPLSSSAMDASISRNSSGDSGGSGDGGMGVRVTPGEKNLRGIAYPITTMSYNVSNENPTVRLTVSSTMPDDVQLRPDDALRLVMEPFLVESLYGTRRDSGDYPPASPLGSSINIPLGIPVGRNGDSSVTASHAAAEAAAEAAVTVHPAACSAAPRGHGFYAFFHEDPCIGVSGIGGVCDPDSGAGNAGAATTDGVAGHMTGIEHHSQDESLYFEADVSQGLAIAPGTQPLSMRFRPTAAGEFAPRVLLLRAGRITFVDTVVQPASWLLGLSRDDLFLTVEAPADCIALRSDVPERSPLGQRDKLVLHVDLSCVVRGVTALNISEKYGVTARPEQWVVSAGTVVCGRGITITDLGGCKHVTVTIPFVLGSGGGAGAGAVSSGGGTRKGLSFVVDADLVIGGCRVSRSLTHNCIIRSSTFLSLSYRIHSRDTDAATSTSTCIVEYMARNVLNIALKLQASRPSEADRNGGSGGSVEDAVRVRNESSSVVLLPGDVYSTCLRLDMSGPMRTRQLPAVMYTISRQDGMGFTFTQTYEPDMGTETCGTTISPTMPPSSLSSSPIRQSRSASPRPLPWGTDPLPDDARPGTVGGTVVAFELSAMGDKQQTGLLLSSVGAPTKLHFTLTVLPHTHSTTGGAGSGTGTSKSSQVLQALLERYESRVAVNAPTEAWSIAGTMAQKFVLNESTGRIMVYVSVQATPLVTGALALPFLTVDGVQVYSDPHCTTMLVT